MGSNYKGLKVISGYSDTIDLKVLASNLRDKEKSEKILDREFKLAALEEEFFKIKRLPYPLATDTTTESYIPSNCQSCFDEDEDVNQMCNFYIDLLNIKQLQAQKNSSNFMKSALKVLFYGCKQSVIVTDQVIRNNYLLEFLRSVEESVELNPKENGSSRYSYETMLNWVKGEAERTKYQFSRICGLAVVFLYNISNYFMERLVISSSELKCVTEAEKKKIPIIYILRNQSRLDWFVVLCVQLFCGLKAPVVLLHKCEKTIFSWIYEKIGAVYIRPRRDDLQKTNARYLVYDETWLVNFEENLVANNHMMFYLNNSCGSYDYDLMYGIMDAIKRETVADVFVVPVVVNYEKRDSFDDSTETSSLSAFRKCLQFFKFGFVNVNFLKLFSVKKLMSSLHGRRSLRDITDEKIGELTPKMLLHIDYDFYRETPITSTSLVSYLLLRKFRNGIQFEDLAKELLEIRNVLMYAKVRLSFSGKTEAVIKHALKLLGGKLVNINETAEGRVISPVLELPHVLETNSYALETLSHFMTRSVIFRIVASLFPKEFDNGFRTTDELKFSFDDLLRRATGLCDILMFEYPFHKPCKDLRTTINEVFYNCCDEGYFMKVEKLMTEEERWGHRFARHLEDSDSFEDDDDNYSSSPLVHRNSDMFLVNLNGPKSFFNEVNLHKNNMQMYIDAYLISAEHLSTLINKQLPEMYYMKTLISKIMSKLENKQIQYAESVSVDILKHTITFFIERKVMSSYSIKDIELLSLNIEYNNHNSLSTIVSEIKQYQM